MKKEVTVGVRICSSMEMMERMLGTSQVQVLLISEEVPYEKRRQASAGRRIVLTRQHCTDLGAEERELRKYQTAERLTAEILQVFQEEPFLMQSASRGKCRILGVYSPVHRIGKTTFALKLGKLLAEKENVLYLNLETYAGMGGYFREQDTKNLSHLLYYAKQDKDDISMRIASIVRQMGKMDYIPPLKVWTDLKSVSVEEWGLLFEKLSTQSIYDTLILDIGDVVDGVFEMLRMCDRIVLPYEEDVYAKAKMAQYRYMLNVLGFQELDGKTVYVDMAKNMRQAVKDAVQELKESKGKERVHAAGRTAS